MKLRHYVALALGPFAGVASAAGMDAPPPDVASHYSVFIHSGGGKPGETDVNAVLSALAQRGYLVRPPDGQRDAVGGAGVDYFVESDKDVAQDIANVVNNLIYEGLAKVHPRFQRIRNPPGYIGVWLYGNN
jgi:hypothetical protein